MLAPGAIEAALKSATDATGKQDELQRAVALELEQAEYEAERARRQFDAVEPENRLVAATLESRWMRPYDPSTNFVLVWKRCVESAARTHSPIASHCWN